MPQIYQSLKNIFHLGVKELWSLLRDPAMLILIIYVFTFGVYTAATAMPETLHKAAIAIVDEDNSPLSSRLVNALYPPYFVPPQHISWQEMDRGMDLGKFTFALVIPHNFQKDLLAGKNPQVQLNVDATRMSQAFVGSGYIQQIVQQEIMEYAQRYRAESIAQVDLVLRTKFNPSLNPAWFGSLVQIINHIAMLSIILAGAALIREREKGTLEHLLVMPVTPAEIMLSKIWSMSLVVILAAWLSLTLIVQKFLAVPIAGSKGLFFIGAGLTLFATTALGIFLATLARNMPQFAMLVILIIMPLQMLSGGSTPRESMPQLLQDIMLTAPTTHFIQMGQAILFRGAGIELVWVNFLALFLIGLVLFGLSLIRFKSELSRL